MQAPIDRNLDTGKVQNGIGRWKLEETGMTPPQQNAA
jgi:hypothetical protein